MHPENFETLEMPFPAIWALNYELQFDFKKGKTLEIVPISEFEFFAPLLTKANRGTHPCAPPYKSIPEGMSLPGPLQRIV